MINISEKDGNDAYCRYRMEKLEIGIAGKGRNKKTLILNMGKIAKALRTNPKYITKYFGLVLNAETGLDSETSSAYIKGNHDASNLAMILTKFIKMFIMCWVCDDAGGLRLKVSHDAVIGTCDACGNSIPVGQNDKLTKFIIKNPPKKRDRKSEEQVGAFGAFEERPNDDDDKWHTDTSAEATATRLKHATQSSGIMHGLGKGSTVDILRRLFDVEQTDIFELTHKVSRLTQDFDSRKRLNLIFGFIFDTSDSKQIISMIKKYSELLATFSTGKANGAIFTRCVEKMICDNELKLIARSPIFFQQLYENDILD